MAEEDKPEEATEEAPAEEATEEAPAEEPAQEEAAEEEAPQEQTGGSDRPQREMFDITCADCGQKSQVPFKPDGTRPVYCRDCYSKHRPPRKF